MTWHWAHKSDDCDPWSEPETEWHRKWKASFPVDWVEVTKGPHRADVLLPTGEVLEFQHSPISIDEIKEREDFWGVDKLIWIFDLESAWDRFRFKETQLGISFQWKAPRKTVWHVRSRMYFDFAGKGPMDFMLEAKEVDQDLPCTGWGIWRNTKVFVDRLTMPQKQETLVSGPGEGEVPVV